MKYTNIFFCLTQSENCPVEKNFKVFYFKFVKKETSSAVLIYSSLRFKFDSRKLEKAEKIRSRNEEVFQRAAVAKDKNLQGRVHVGCHVQAEGCHIHTMRSFHTSRYFQNL